MAARGYEFYLRVQIDTNEFPTEKTTFSLLFIFEKQNSAIKVVTYRKMPVTKML